jgi:hypothetical protein
MIFGCEDMPRKGCCIILLLLLVLISFSNVNALPMIPHDFYGTVTINGQPAPDGTLIEAVIYNITSANTTTSSGNYSLMVLADDPDTLEIEGGRQGDLINFYVNKVYVVNYTFVNGEVTNLNLKIDTQPSQPPSPPSIPSILPNIVDAVNALLRTFTQPIGTWFNSSFGQNAIIDYLFVQQPIVLLVIIIIVVCLLLYYKSSLKGKKK